MILKPSTTTLSKAAAALKKGEVVICPTDTVYGFLVDASNKRAVDKIYKIKKRPKSKPLPVFVKDIKMAKELAFIDADQEKVLKKYWPGKFTFVMATRLRQGSGEARKTIALRVPKHAFLNKILKKVNRPLAQTSVNISGQDTLVKIKDIVDTFEKDKKITLIIDGGNLKKSKPSTIIDLTSKELKQLR